MQCDMAEHGQSSLILIGLVRCSGPLS